MGTEMTTVSNDGKPPKKDKTKEQIEEEKAIAAGAYWISPEGIHPTREKKLIEIYTGWPTRRDAGRLGYVAQSPKFKKDGIEISGKGSKQVIDRILALLNLEIPEPPKRKIESGKPLASVDLMKQAREDGYTGEACQFCGSMKMVRIGKHPICEGCRKEAEES